MHIWLDLAAGKCFACMQVDPERTLAVDPAPTERKGRGVKGLSKLLGYLWLKLYEFCRSTTQYLSS